MQSKSPALAAIALASALGVATLDIGPAAAHGSGGSGYRGGHMMHGGYHMMDHGHHMMGHGMTDHGMKGHGMTGHAKRGHRSGGMGLGIPGPSQHAEKNLSASDVTKILEALLAWHGNDRLKVGKVVEKDENTIIAEIVTVEDSLVERLAVDRKTGRRSRAK
ncbi:MAG: hypothetical protein CMF63_08495 [Magnetovibrio sp.]|jgi:hypothetical protein|nr:hypothetical protein [Magnetovibrio sp.]